MAKPVDLGPLGVVDFPDEMSDREIYDYLKSDTFKTVAQNSGNAEHFGFSPTDLAYAETLERGFESGAETAWSAVLTDLAAAGALSPEAASELIAEAQRSKQKIAAPASVEEFMQQEGFKDTFQEFLGSPLEIGLYLSAEGLGTSIPALGLGVAGGVAASAVPGVGTIVGGAAGLGLGSALVEGGATILEEMAKNGVNITKAEEVAAALQNEEFMSQAIVKGATKGAIVGSMDAATAGVAGKILSATVGRALVTRATAYLSELGVQVAGGMGGEYLGSKAIGREASWPELLAEGIGEGFTGTAEIGVGTVVRVARDRAANRKPEQIEFDGQVFTLEKGEVTSKGKPSIYKKPGEPKPDEAGKPVTPIDEIKPEKLKTAEAEVGDKIDLEDANMGMPAKLGNYNVTYLGRGTYEGMDAALIRLEDGTVGPVNFNSLTFEPGVAIQATTIPEVQTKEDMDTASAEELAEQGTEPYGPKEAFGPHIGGIPYEDAVEMGLTGPTQTYFNALPPYLRVIEKERYRWPLSPEDWAVKGESISDVDTELNDNIDWLGRNPKRVSRKQLNALMKQFPDISEKTAKTWAKIANEQAYNLVKNKGQPTEAQRAKQSKDFHEEATRKDQWGETYKRDAARLEALARELSYRGYNNPRTLEDAEQGAARRRPIKKDIARVAEIMAQREEYNALRERFGLRPVTNWENVKQSEIQTFRFKQLGQRVAPPTSDVRFSRIFADVLGLQPEEVVEELGRGLQHINVLQEAMREILDGMGLSHVDLRLSEFLNWVDSNGEKHAIKGHYYNSIIKIGLRSTSSPLTTLNHETIHALKDINAFTKQEWKLLSRYAKQQWMGEYDIKANYGDMSEIIQLEEAIAHKFGDWATSSNNSTNEPSGIKAIFAKMMGVIEAIGRWLNGEGFASVDEVLERIKSGTVGQRHAPSFSEFKANPNDLPIDETNYRKTPRFSKEANHHKQRTKELKDGDLFNPKDIGRLGRWLGTMRHIAHQNARFARMMINFEHMREKRMMVANDASILLQPLGRLQKRGNAEALDDFNKAAEISQLVPGKYRPDADGRITFVAPDTAPLGINSKVIPGETVVLEGDAAFAYLSVQKVFKETILDELRKSMLTDNGDLFLRLKDAGFIPAEAQLTEDFINSMGQFDTMSTMSKEVKSLLEDAVNALELLKQQGVKKTHPAMVAARKTVAALEMLNHRMLPMIDNLRTFNDFTGADYFPFMRFGDHYLAVVEEGSKHAIHYEQMEFPWHVTHGSKTTRLNERKRELETMYPDAKVVGGMNTLNEMKRHLGDVGLSMELAASFLHGKKADMWEQVKGELEKARKTKGFRQHFQPRSDTPGYNTDFTRAIAQYVQAMSGAIASSRYAKPLNMAMADVMENEGSRMRAYAKSAYDYISSPIEEYNNWRKAMFMWYLGGNISSALLQTMSVVQFTGPYLAQFGPTTKVGFELARAFKDASKTFAASEEAHLHKDILLDFTKIPEDVKPEVMRAVENGIIKQMAVLEESGISPVRQSRGAGGPLTWDKLGSYTDSLATTLSMPFNTVESMSRMSAFIAAIRLARNPKYNKKINEVLSASHLWNEENKFGETADPEAFAKFVVDETFGLYGKTNRAPYARGKMAVVLQFQSYIHMMWELILRSLGSKTGGKKALAGILLMLMLTGGLSSLPGADDAMDLYDFTMKNVSGIDPMVKTTMREMMHDTTNGNPFATEMLTSGLFNALGYDVQQRISMGNVPGADMIRALMGVQGDAADVLGLPGAVVFDNVKNGSQMMFEGRWDEAIQHAMPMAMKNVYQAQYIYPTYGIRTAKGSQIMTPEQWANTSMVEQTGKLLGFSPTTISKEREKSYQVRRLNDNITIAKERYTSRLADAMFDQFQANKAGNSGAAVRAYAKMQTIMKQIWDHNVLTEPENRIIINLTNVQQRAIMRMYPEMQALQGADSRVLGRAIEQQELYE